MAGPDTLTKATYRIAVQRYKHEPIKQYDVKCNEASTEELMRFVRSITSLGDDDPAFLEVHQIIDGKVKVVIGDLEAEWPNVRAEDGGHYTLSIGRKPRLALPSPTISTAAISAAVVVSEPTISEKIVKTMQQIKAKIYDWRD